jgi:hypothetical protein
MVSGERKISIGLEVSGRGGMRESRMMKWGVGASGAWKWQW